MAKSSTSARLWLGFWLIAASVGCGEVAVQGQDPSGSQISGDLGGDQGGDGSATAADSQGQDAIDAAQDVSAGDDVPQGSECVTDYDCISLPGKTPCKLPRCHKGYCQLQPMAPGTVCKSLTATASDCATPRCDQAGECAPTPVTDGTACGFGVCGKKCSTGECVPATAADYEDGNPCTKDWCDQGVQIRHEPITDLSALCDDGDACTSGDACKLGACKGVSASCDDLIECTLDTCKPGSGCQHQPDAKTCDDGDPCTDNGCDLALGCTASAAAPGGTCDDGNACTKGEVCDKAGKCTGTSTCACTSDADCAAAQTNLCLGPLTCVASVCVADPAKEVQCPSGDNCAPISCDVKTGQCAAQAATDGSACNDGNACTTSSSCQKGVCTGAQAANCDDANPCTSDACDPVLGCKSAAASGSCDDGSACTTNDSCSGGACAGTKVSCDDGVACTVDSCDAKTGQCANKADAALCDDGNPCTAVSCDAKAGCLFPADDTAKCDDGDSCTKDACKAGKCVGTNECACKEDSACNDNNPCTVDKCVQNKCVISSAADGASCDTGDKCQLPASGVCQAGACKSGNKPVNCSALADACNNAACDPGSGQCQKVAKTDGSSCDADGNGCTQGDSCQAGKCSAGKPLDCSASSDQCNKGSCVATAVDKASCVKTPVAGGTTCDDGKYCTTGDKCNASGVCASTAALDCSSLNGKCSDGVCDEAAKQCKSQPKSNTTQCDDGLACTSGDKCDGKGGCAAGTPVTCTGTACKPSKCDEVVKGCSAYNAGSGAVCDDGNACTAVDSCDGAGVCKGASPKTCSGDACNTAACDSKTGACVLTPVANGAACSDGNPCTTGDACASGKCSAGSPVVCKGDACNSGVCDTASGACGKKPLTDGTACDDAQACTSGDVCKTGACTSGAWTCSCKPATAATDCNDAKVCTADTCDLVAGAYKCSNTAQPGKVCDDANLCTTGDACTTTGSCAGKAIVCDDGNACTLDKCDGASGKCVNTANTGATCSDGSLCTQYDACGSDGKCSGKAIVCNDGNACTLDTCDASSGKCAFPNTPGSCSDGNACTGSDTCQNGQCIAGALKNCDDGNPCTNDACDAASGNCANTANSLSCTDGNACTLNDVCGSGKCQPGMAVKCSDGKVCTDDSCNTATGACVYLNNSAACDDGSLCTTPDTCKSGACYGTATVCNDNNPCTNDSCDLATGACVYVANTAPCSDSSVCTTGDVCSAGVCKGALIKCTDNNVCTSDTCSPKLGCLYDPVADGTICGVKFLCSTFPKIYCTPTCQAGFCETKPLL